MKLPLCLSLLIFFCFHSEAPAAAQASIWESYMQAGFGAYGRGEYAEAERLFRMAISETTKISPQQKQVECMLDSLNALSGALSGQKKFADAEKVLRKALTLHEAVGEQESADYGRTLNNLGLMLSEQNKFDEAELIHHQALELREKILGPQHSDVAVSLLNLGKIHYDKGNNAAAEALFRRSLTILLSIPFEYRTPEQYHVVGMISNNLGLIYEGRKEYPAAERHFKIVIEYMEQAYGPKHPSLAQYLGNYAKLLRKMNRNAEAAKIEARMRALPSGNR